MGPLNYISFWAIRHPAKFWCTSCKRCNNVCPADGEPYKRYADDVAPNRTLDCIVCHDCQTVCPQKDKGAPTKDKGAPTKAEGTL
jgi:formate hydrogenlyase subunit 6/NADH:ubiquinone oxidoreductase subunit I